MRGEAEIHAFSKAMLRKLQLRERHGDWKQSPTNHLLEWLQREVEELKVDVLGKAPGDEVLMEAADVANLAMMVADKYGALTAESNPYSVQVGGDHYRQMAIQPTEYIIKNGLGFAEGNVIKYVSRWRSKGGRQDLEKAKHYIDLLLESADGL